MKIRDLGLGPKVVLHKMPEVLRGGWTKAVFLLATLSHCCQIPTQAPSEKMNLFWIMISGTQWRGHTARGSVDVVTKVVLSHLSEGGSRGPSPSTHFFWRSPTS